MPDNPNPDSPVVPPTAPEQKPAPTGSSTGAPTDAPANAPQPVPSTSSQPPAAPVKPETNLPAPPAKPAAAPPPVPQPAPQPVPQPAPPPDAPKPPAPQSTTQVPPSKPEVTTGAITGKPMPQPPGPPKAPPPSAAQKCSVCGHVNRPGILVCENCGTNLATGREASVGTKEIGQEEKISESQEVMINTAGTLRFEDNMMLRLEIEGAPTPIVIYPKSETSLGRRDPGTGVAPDIDLTAYAGYRKGVSRNHAMLRLKEKRLELYDLGSSNGTLINGVRLSAHQPHLLRDGDEITLGKMVIRVLFQVRNRTRSLT